MPWHFSTASYIGLRSLKVVNRRACKTCNWRSDHSTVHEKCSGLKWIKLHKSMHDFVTWNTMQIGNNGLTFAWENPDRFSFNAFHSFVYGCWYRYCTVKKDPLHAYVIADACYLSFQQILYTVQYTCKRKTTNEIRGRFLHWSQTLETRKVIVTSIIASQEPTFSAI